MRHERNGFKEEKVIRFLSCFVLSFTYRLPKLCYYVRCTCFDYVLC